MNAQNVKEIMDALAERLGPAGTHVWQVLVRQVYVDAALSALFLGVFTVAWVAVYCKRAAIKEAWDDYNADVVVGMGGLALCILTAIALPICLSHIVQLLNPEYAAIRDLLGGVN